MSDGPPPRERLAAAAHDFYRSRPRIDESHSPLLRRDLSLFRPHRLAAVVAPLFEPRYRVLFDEDDMRRVVCLRRAEPHLADPVPVRDMRERVAGVLSWLPDPVADVPRLVHRAATDTRDLAGLMPAHNIGYVNGVTEHVISALEDLDAGGFEVVRPAAAARAAADATAEHAAREYLAALEPGRHPRKELWDAYSGAVPKYRFLALAREVLGPERTIRGVRCFMVSEPAIAADAFERVAEVALNDQRDIMRRIARREQIDETSGAVTGLGRVA